MYLQFSLDNSNMNSTPWALSEAIFMKIDPVSLKLPNYPIQSLQYIFIIYRIYIICISIILSMYYNSSEYENDDFFSNKSCVTKIALTTSWTPLFLTFERRTAAKWRMQWPVLNPCTGWHFGKLPRLEDLHRSIDKKKSSKIPFPIAMWIYQTIAVGLSKSIVFVCLIITPFGIFLDLKNYLCKMSRFWRKTWMFRYGTHCSCCAFVRYFVFSLWRQSISIHASSLDCPTYVSIKIK